MSSKRTFNDVVSALQQKQKEGHGCSVLLGAGCSVKGGIPAAKGFLTLLKRNFPEAFEKTPVKGYQQCLAALSPEERNKLFSSLLDAARLNWANVCAAILLSKGYIDRIFTTNYDPLLRRACALVGLFPPVYDPTVAQVLKPGAFPRQLICYLHGQSPEFSVTGIKEKSQAYWESVGGVLKEGCKDRSWLVVGYDGGNDPVFDQLNKLGKFENGLFWVGNKDAPLKKHIQDGPLADGRQASHVSGYDADSFFVALCQKLEILPPDFMSRPFTYLEDLLKDLANFPLPGQNQEVGVTNATRIQLQMAAAQLESPKQDSAENKGMKEALAKAMEAPDLIASIVKAQSALMKGDMDGVLAQREQFEKTPSPQLGELMGWAWMSKGKSSFDQAESKTGDVRYEGFQDAGEKFELALGIHSNLHQARRLWARALLEQAKLKTGDEARDLYAQAEEKFQKTVEANPELADAYYGWGYVLYELGKMEDSQEKAETCFAQAEEKYQAALAKRPDLYLAHYGLGHALQARAARLPAAEAQPLLEQAADKFKAALDLTPDFKDAMAQLGALSLKLAETQTGKEADALLVRAGEQFRNVLNADPENRDAQYGWARTLCLRAKTQPADIAETMYKEAVAKYEEAAKLQTPDAALLCEWGETFLSHAALKEEGVETTALLEQAAEKFESALNNEPDNFKAVNQLGNLALQLAKGKEGQEEIDQLQKATNCFQDSLALEPNNYDARVNLANAQIRLSALDKPSAATRLKEAEEALEAAVKLNPNGHEAMNQLGNLLVRRARGIKGSKAEELTDKAVGYYKSALKLKPEYPDAFAHWGNSLYNLACNKEGADAEKLFQEAGEKFEAALKMDPNQPDALIPMGLILMQQAKNKKGINAHPMYAEAKKKFQQAEEMRPGSATYNLARLMAILANESGCKQWLNKCLELKVLPDQQSLLKDPGLESVRESKWFKLLIYDAFVDQKPATDPVEPG